MIQLLPYEQCPEMLWKNGQGVTREIYRFPATDNYAWRISVATIRQDGPFSLFSGYLRNISVLEGEGMYLTVDGEQSPLIPPFQATDFSGDSEVSCTIVGGPLLDFNVIYKAESTRATVSWLREGTWKHQQGTQLLFNAGDDLEVEVNGERQVLQHYDSLLMSAPATVSVVSAASSLFARVTLSA
ncbi:HutD family protein [Enterobacter sp. Ap-916]|uniref:HutD family protein n=1 Tax=Enterobacteriaceae TaxID=543 RepID=UPI0014200A04|nr:MULTISPECIES: HutD family protein [unclassified Enterobacter]NIF57683.1 HutD family protein [Enterobacter sp. Ap-867]NIG28374.1 HutD family protein [Enterobacter sp. Ap-916]